MDVRIAFRLVENDDGTVRVYTSDPDDLTRTWSLMATENDIYDATIAVGDEVHDRWQRARPPEEE